MRARSAALTRRLALRDVWLTTEDGDVVRADGIAGSHIKLVGPPGERETPQSPIDVELWMTVEHFGHPIRLVCEAAEHVPDLLAELITLMSEAADAEASTLYVRPVPTATSEGGVGACWVVEAAAPTERWRDFLLG